MAKSICDGCDNRVLCTYTASKDGSVNGKREPSVVLPPCARKQARRVKQLEGILRRRAMEKKQ